MSQMTNRQTANIWGSAHSTSTVKYICQTMALLWQQKFKDCDKKFTITWNN